MSVCADLKKARAHIEDPKHWVKNRLYRHNEDGSRAFDAIGALWFTGGGRGSVAALNKAAAGMGFLDAETLNDLSDHSTVLRMFDLAINECGQ